MENARKIDAPSEAVRQFREKEDLDRFTHYLHIPTNDDDVRRLLRENAQPAELPNESREKRRERLSAFLARKKRNSLDDEKQRDDSVVPETKTVIEAYTSEGGGRLLEVRQEIERYVFKTRECQPRSVKTSLSPLISLYGSQSGFGRAVSSVKFLANQNCGVIPRVIAADWSGTLSLLALNDNMTVQKQLTLKEAGILSGLCINNEMISVGTSSGWIPLIRLDTDAIELHQIGILAGHESRVTSVLLHPNNRVALSASYDLTWRLWDLERSEAVLTQDGHTEKLTGIKINPEGSIAATSSYDKSAKLWDLRSGVLILSNEDHIREVNTVAWKSNWEYASAGADNVCLLYDLRNNRMPVGRIYAHKNAITDIVFSDESLVTASYDNTIKFWDFETHKLLNEVYLGSRIMGIDSDIHNNIVAGRWDRSVNWLK